MPGREEVMEAGYGISGFDLGDVAPDTEEMFTEGILGLLYPEQIAMDNAGCGAW